MGLIAVRVHSVAAVAAWVESFSFIFFIVRVQFEVVIFSIVLIFAERILVSCDYSSG